MRTMMDGHWKAKMLLSICLFYYAHLISFGRQKGSWNLSLHLDPFESIFFFSFSPKQLLFYSKYSTNYASHPCAVEFIVYTLCLTRKQDAHFIRCLTWIRKIPIRSNGKKCPAPLDLPCSSWIFPASKRWWDGDNFCLPYPTLNVYVCVLYCLQNKQLALIYYYSHCFSFP